MGKKLAAIALLLALPGTTALAQALTPGQIDSFAGKPRVVVLSDIGNEPDDQMSLVRLLLYSNEIDVEALVAVTSTWLKRTTNPDKMHEIVAAYAQVRPNLMRNADGWPEAAKLDDIVTTGQPAYGIAAVGPGLDSPGAEAIIRLVDRPDPRPLWISIWGGANTLAQALTKVRATRSAEALDAFVARLRVYSISDQDDAGPWIRREFPGLTYIATPSRPDSSNYTSATWTGISGDIYYRNGSGADGRTITNAWLDEHIRKGPLGAHFPRHMFIMEGDTPAFLGFTDNGLNSVRNPGWGGWGGRYIWLQPYGESHPFWSQGGDVFGRITSSDTVVGVDGRRYTSDQATIWRWRTAFQNDFAARMAWTIGDPSRVNHQPLAIVNGIAGTAPIFVKGEGGKPITFDASATWDRDRGQKLHYRWFHYTEAGYAPGRAMAVLQVRDAHTAKVTVTTTATCAPNWLKASPPCPQTGTAHLILEVTDNGTPALTSYRRVVLTVKRQPVQ